MNIAFFAEHFTERGTGVAIFDYAKYNEDILNNKSYIICFTERVQKIIHTVDNDENTVNKFNERFKIIEIEDISEMKDIVTNYNISFFYTLVYGNYDNNIFQYDNKNIWGKCKTIKHCVFSMNCPQSDFYIGISEYLTLKDNNKYLSIPHIANLPNNNENLREELQIPKNAIVYGRYGGMDEFDIDFVKKTIQEYVNLDENCYFLFMNTRIFYNHPRIIYLEKNVNLNYKTTFINTCDAMIHARCTGETFGLSIAEFSIKNKPIITSYSGDLCHIHILQDKAVIYDSKESLINIFKNIKSIIKSRDDWNAYKLYTPENVMNLFDKVIFNKTISNI